MENLSSVRFDENDDIANVIDTILSRPGLRLMYEKRSDRNWIDMVGNTDLEERLRELPEVEKSILEKFFFQGKDLLDISSDLGLPMELLLGHIKSVKIRLEIYVQA